MRIDLLFVADCPHRDLTRARLDAALARAGVRASVHEVEIASNEDADRWGMRGSPTVLIDGIDPFGDGDASLSCRLYRTAQGTDGAPSIEHLIDALEQRP